MSAGRTLQGRVRYYEPLHKRSAMFPLRIGTDQILLYTLANCITAKRFGKMKNFKDDGKKFVMKETRREENLYQ